MAAAEAWCLESLSINTAGIAQDKLVSLRLDLRVADLKDLTDIVRDGEISIPRLIDILSRQARTLQPHWTVDVPPFRLADLRRAAARGPRSG